MLKYGPTPAGVGNRSALGAKKSKNKPEDMPSYKKDAMRLIFNRIQRQIGNAFEELQKKVMRDDIMRLQRNGEVLFNQDNGLRSKRITPGFTNENDSILNNMEDEEMFNEPKSKFRQMYEMKKQKIKATYEYNHDESVHQSVDFEQTNQDGPLNNNYKYITENHHHHHHYYGSQSEQDNDNKDEMEENIRQDNQLYQRKERSKSRSQNNRYQNEDDQDYNDEQTADVENTEAEKQQHMTGSRVDMMKRKERLKSSSQKREITPIQETNESFEISPEQVPIVEVVDIIQPSKLVKSYLQTDETQTSKSKLGLIVRSTKQQNAVEMSFSENPFDKRLSSFAQANNQSGHNQSSPDFKARDQTNSFNKSQMRQTSFKNLKSQALELKKQNNFQSSHNENSLSKISEISSDQLTVNLRKDNKQKFSDKLKNLMNDFDVVKPGQLNSQFSEENISSIDNFIQDSDLMSKGYNSNPRQEEEEKKGESKMVMLRKKIVQKDQSQMQQRQEPVGIQTPLGMMYNITQNAVLFEEKRVQPIVIKTYTVQSKKNTVQALQKEEILQDQNIFERQPSESEQLKERKLAEENAVLIQINNERLNEAGQKLYAIIKQKQMINFKQAFDQIKQLTLLIKKQIVDQLKKRSVQKIALYLQNKEKILLNKKFQKYRKCCFLHTFNMKLVGLSKLLNNKVAYQKKEAFKQIISICLKNDGFKQQIEELNYQNESQKQKVKQLQLTLIAKVSKNALLKCGFKVLQQHSTNKSQQYQSLKKLQSLLKQKQNHYIQDSFSLIKKKAIFMNKLKNSLQKLQEKVRKRSLNEFIQRWKQEVYRGKLIRVNLQIVLKAHQNRVKQNQNKYFQRWRAYKQLIKQKSQADGAKLLNRIAKTIDKKRKQKVLMTWRLNSQTQNANHVKNEMVKQFQNRMLKGLATKIKTILTREGFLALKAYNDIKIRQSQEKRVAVAISVIASATKICQIIENKRIDRVYFQLWKSLIQKQKQIMLGSQILRVFYNKRVQKEFIHMKQQVHIIQIQQAKKQISLNIIKVLLYKLYKEQVQRAFNNWMLQDNRNRINQNFISNNQKPPKYNTNNQESGSAQTITITRIFGQHSRTNSANNSIINQSNSGRNMRYSHQGDDDDYDDYDNYEQYSKKNKSPKTILSNVPPSFQRHSSLDIIITSEQEQSQSSHHMQGSSSARSLKNLNSGSNSNTNKNQTNQRYNNKSQKSLNSFQDYDREVKSQKSPKFGKVNGSVKFLEEYDDYQDSPSEKRSEQADQQSLNYNAVSESNSQRNEPIPIQQQQQQVQQFKKASNSRNKTSSLNKYLNNNKASNASNENASTIDNTKTGTIKSQITPRGIAQQAQPIESSMNQRSTFQSIKSNNESYNNDPLQRQDLDNEDDEEEKGLFKSPSKSKIMSPKSQTTLEPVPEETYPKKKSPKKQQTKQSSQKSQRAASTTGKLSQFFSQNVSNTSSNLPNNKEKKEKSRENQQKYKVFLMNAQNKQKKSPSKKSARSLSTKQEPIIVEQIVKPINSQRPINNQSIQKGMMKLQELLQQKVYRNTFEHIITRVFDYSYQGVYQDKINKRRVQKLQSVLQLRTKIINKKQYLLWEAFALWKRLDYISMLTSLQQFKESLNSIYNVKK